MAYRIDEWGCGKGSGWGDIDGSGYGDGCGFVWIRRWERRMIKIDVGIHGSEAITEKVNGINNKIWSSKHHGRVFYVSPDVIIKEIK